MLFSPLLEYLKPRGRRRRKPQRLMADQGRAFRPHLEALEDRTVPATFTAASVSDLIADINAANKHGGSNTITLVAGNTFALTAWNNYTDGATGLPVIAAKANLTILGNGDTIARSTAAGTPAFRLLDVAAGASLTLKNLTLQGGWAFGLGVSAEGGAIFNQGTLDLSGVTVQNNVAQGNNNANAAGGGIYSSGSLTLEAGTKVLNNQALGDRGYVSSGGMEGPLLTGRGGDGLGGGLYVAGGTLTVINASVSSNTALGGRGVDGGTFLDPAFMTALITVGPGDGGNGLGGGLYVQAGTVTLTNATLSANTAQGGQGGNGIPGYGRNGKPGPAGRPGLGKGGGIYIYPGASVRLDAFTLAYTTQNIASTSDPDIAGSYATI